jgi:NAD+ kinase
MEKFLIVTNEARDPGLEITRRMIDYLHKKGASCWSANKMISEDSSFDIAKAAELLPDGADCVLVLGGDGTLLRSARKLVHKNIPFLGINSGHLGYLTEGDKSKAEDILDRVIADEYFLEERMMLDGRILAPDGTVRAEGTALNDITLNRCRYLRIIKFKLYVNGEFLYYYTADGIIVSTPTGLTAYSLSCGGPVVEPTARLFVLTPIAPHSLNNRSLILSANDKLELELIGAGSSDPAATTGFVSYYDGEDAVTLQPGDRIEVVKSQRVAKIVKLSRQSFLETIRIRMS